MKKLQWEKEQLEELRWARPTNEFNGKNVLPSLEWMQKPKPIYEDYAKKNWMELPQFLTDQYEAKIELSKEMELEEEEEKDLEEDPEEESEGKPSNADEESKSKSD
ncbi:hypothetical protein PVK06_034777 [Gossypium arboreum]|uniref:Uncharacterized protein n=1 Tax=Gossypium arboreum TaxID=29729 RepID=A0ABR0NF28_GOSAR|nr:hypothetical protein PVK06_034777 [Gossypium arboreum]